MMGIYHLWIGDLDLDPDLFPDHYPDPPFVTRSFADPDPNPPFLTRSRIADQ